jgi:penicillin amidase
MSSNDPNTQDPQATISSAEPVNADSGSATAKGSGAGRRRRIAGFVFFLLIAIAGAALFVWQRRVRTEMRENLPQLDGSITAFGLSAPVTVERDAHGVPHLHASSMNDLIFAQGYVTAQDRLWQMELLRRHAAGALAAIFGRSLLDQDRLQRMLQLRAAADRAFAGLPADQKLSLEVYAAGVNASMAAQRDHLPIEFRVLGFVPSPWTPRDSVLVQLAMYQDLTTGFPQKLDREALAAHLAPELIADLYPTGSWRDHPPGQVIPDPTAPQPEVPGVPLDESQSMLRRTTPMATEDLLALNRTLALFHGGCDTCVAGSNGWAR